MMSKKGKSLWSPLVCVGACVKNIELGYGSKSKTSTTQEGIDVWNGHCDTSFP
jgi:hypothetical protein